MRNMTLTLLARYAIVLVAVVLGTLARWLLGPFVGDAHPFITYFAVVAFTAWWGGVGPGLASVILSAAAADFFFLPPPGEFMIVSGSRVVGLSIFCVVGSGITGLVGMLHQ